MVDTFGKFAEAGVQGAMGYVIGLEDPKVLDVMGSRVIPQLKQL